MSTKECLNCNRKFHTIKDSLFCGFHCRANYRRKIYSIIYNLNDENLKKLNSYLNEITGGE